MLETARLTTANELAAHMCELTAAELFEVIEPAGAFRCATVHARTGSLVAVKQAISAETRMLTESSCDSFVFHITASGQSTLTSDSGSVVEPAGMGHVLTTRDGIGLNSSAGAVRLGLSASRTTLMRILRDHFDDRSRSELVFQSTFRADASGGKLLSSMIESFLSGATKRLPLKRTTNAIGESLLTLLLEAFPHSHTDRITGIPASLQPRHVRRAIDLMEEHAGSGLSIISLAEMLGVSARALQYAFTRHVGVTPVRYMHDVRVRRAARDLMERSDRSAKETAAIWGFSNFSRFSLACLKMFGKRPHELQR